MSAYDFPSPNASITTEEAEELMLSRLAGESDLHFAVRSTRIACNRWLSASNDLKQAHRNGYNTEVMRKFETVERKAKHTLTTRALMLVEALTEKAA